MRALIVAVLAVLLLACTEGSSVASLNLQDYQGRWLVVNYWAKWCKPCIEEIPELNALAAKYPQVAVLGVNFDGASGEELAGQIHSLGIEFPVLAQDPSGTLGVALPPVLPATFILNPDGKLVHSLVGPQTLESLALATGQAAIPESGPSAGDLIEEPH